MLRLSNRVTTFVAKWSRSCSCHFSGGTSQTAYANLLEQHQLRFIETRKPFPLLSYRRIIGDQPVNNVLIENPRHSLLNEIKDIVRNESVIYTPPQAQKDEIQAARLIVIRRRKMKKHKLKKLRKKMKFEWAKVRQRREMRKEKAFQAELIFQIRESQKFSAEQYVLSKLKKANETPIPRFWKGRRLPQFIIKQKLGFE